MSNGSLSKQATIASWVAQLVAAGILGMASVFKLTSQPDSIALFEAVGAEPWGRYLMGLTELVTVILLLRPSTAGKGGLLAIVLMVGALGTHLFKIGISYGGDASLFLMAVVTLLCGLAVVAIRKPRVPGVGGPR